MKLVRAALVAFACLALGAPGGAMPTGQTTRLENLPGPEVSLAKDRTGRVRAPVYVNGQGPFNFIVDTAANRSAVSAALVERLGLPVAGASDVHALSGPFTATLVTVATLRSGALELSSAELPIISRDVLADADGLLGVEAMAGRQLTMDFENDRIVISPGRSPLPERGWSRVDGRLRFGNLIVVRATVGRTDVNVIIDTGAERSVGNLALRDALARYSSGHRTLDSSTRTLNAARPIVLDQAVYIPRLRLGRVDVTNVVTAVGDAYVFTLWGMRDEPTIVLGMDVLRQSRAMTIDYERGTVHFLL